MTGKGLPLRNTRRCEQCGEDSRICDCRVPADPPVLCSSCGERPAGEGFEVCAPCHNEAFRVASKAAARLADQAGASEVHFKIG